MWAFGMADWMWQSDNLNVGADDVDGLADSESMSQSGAGCHCVAVNLSVNIQRYIDTAEHSLIYTALPLDCAVLFMNLASITCSRAR